jgi:hypothetical protein
MNSDDPDDRDNNHPTIDVTFGENGKVTATAVIDTQISTSLLTPIPLLRSPRASSWISEMT